MEYERFPWDLNIQWNLSIAATVGEWDFGRYTEVAVVERLFTYYISLIGTRAVGRYIADG